MSADRPWATARLTPFRLLAFGTFWIFTCKGLTQSTFEPLSIPQALPTAPASGLLPRGGGRLLTRGDVRQALEEQKKEWESLGEQLKALEVGFSLSLETPPHRPASTVGFLRAGEGAAARLQPKLTPRQSLQSAFLSALQMTQPPLWGPWAKVMETCLKELPQTPGGKERDDMALLCATSAVQLSQSLPPLNSDKRTQKQNLMRLVSLPGSCSDAPLASWCRVLQARALLAWDAPERALEILNTPSGSNPWGGRVLLQRSLALLQLESRKEEGIRSLKTLSGIDPHPDSLPFGIDANTRFWAQMALGKEALLRKDFAGAYRLLSRVKPPPLTTIHPMAPWDLAHDSLPLRKMVTPADTDLPERAPWSRLLNLASLASGRAPSPATDRDPSTTDALLGEEARYLSGAPLSGERGRSALTLLLGTLDADIGFAQDWGRRVNKEGPLLDTEAIAAEKALLGIALSHGIQFPAASQADKTIQRWKGYLAALEDLESGSSALRSMVARLLDTLNPDPLYPPEKAWAESLKMWALSSQKALLTLELFTRGGWSQGSDGAKSPEEILAAEALRREWLHQLQQGSAPKRPTGRAGKAGDFRGEEHSAFALEARRASLRFWLWEPQTPLPMSPFLALDRAMGSDFVRKAQTLGSQRKLLEHFEGWGGYDGFSTAEDDILYTLDRVKSLKELHSRMLFLPEDAGGQELRQSVLGLWDDASALLREARDAQKRAELRTQSNRQELVRRVNAIWDVLQQREESWDSLRSQWVGESRKDLRTMLPLFEAALGKSRDAVRVALGSSARMAAGQSQSQAEALEKARELRLRWLKALGERQWPDNAPLTLPVQD